MAARPNELQLELVLCQLEVNECKNCHVPLPLSMFGRCVVRGREYRRSWCKLCEAWRERQRWERQKGEDEFAAVRATDRGMAAWDALTRRLTQQREASD